MEAGGLMGDVLMVAVALAAVPTWLGFALLGAGALILSALWWAR